MAYRCAPTKLASTATNLIKGNLLKRAPVWLQAVKNTPPGPSIIRAREIDPSLQQNNAVEQKTRYKQKHLRTKAPRPLRIVYPEDKLRRQFFKDHPFELARPKVLVENTNATNRTDYSTLLLPGMHPSEVDGETVIRYQLHLMTNENMTEREAYSKATSEFYEIRAQEEIEAREQRKKMEETLQRPLRKYWTERGIKLEELALKEGERI
ncbi:mitochondrial ribosomal protein S25 [Syncephalastrum racemosum]|uniref:Small ribosomal subunit protein mS23 n=1 Tax=Syncephalastrum racemosum TaxID=13706 RepID=A0A1X2HHK9_SYNRA|nr:mitochondrial ribosomal protein S25 [Syncephalastrum racemosum]